METVSTYRVAAAVTQFADGSTMYYSNYHAESTKLKTMSQTKSMDKMGSILHSNARAPVAQLVRASDQSSEDPSLNRGWITMSFFAIVYLCK